ncbi:hypothetical protein [Streptomyces sp. NPDC058155]|uniref:hypothetical protein n=1 Tax=Streptomyces sp. NPDC058155 TaxID=3346359 RepID=UPI0036E83AB7
MTVVLYGVARNDLARSLGGACLTMTSLTLIALVSIRRWTTNTDAERRRLGDATREAETEKTRSIAAQAAMEVERDRLLRDAASRRARLDAQLKTERKAMRDQLEADRAQIAIEALEEAFRLIRGGLCDPSKQPGEGTVIEFPEQPSERPAAVRPRGH